MRKTISFVSLLVLLLSVMMPVIAQDMAQLRVANFSPDSEALDVYLDGELVAEGLEFSEVTAFFEVEGGTYEITFVPSASGIDAAVFEAFEVTLDADDNNTTVAAVGSSERETMAATVFVEDYSAVPAGQARVTLLHTIEGEGALDLYGSGFLLIQAVTYPNLSAGRDGAFTRDLPLGRYNFDLSIGENASAIIREVDGLELVDGGYYLIVALGPQTLDGELLVVLPEGYDVPEGDDDESAEVEEPVATEEAVEEETEMSEVVEGSAQLRVANFSPDSEALDVYLNGELVAEGLEFPEVTAFFGVEGATYEIAFVPSAPGIDAAVFEAFEVTLDADDNNTTVAAVGSSERETMAATVFTEDYSAVPAGQARVTLLHTIEGEGALDLYGSGILLIQAVTYPNLSAGRDGAFTRDLPLGRYNFDLSIGENASAIIREADGLELVDGGYYLMVALGPQTLDGELLVVTPEGYTNPDEE